MDLKCFKEQIIMELLDFAKEVFIRRKFKADFKDSIKVEELKEVEVFAIRLLVMDLVK